MERIRTISYLSEMIASTRRLNREHYDAVTSQWNELCSHGQQSMDTYKVLNARSIAASKIGQVLEKYAKDIEDLRAVLEHQESFDNQ